MNRNEPASAAAREDSPLDERICLELMLELQPFPCLIVHNRTARAVLANVEARRLMFDRLGASPSPDEGSWSASAEDGSPLELERVIPYLLGRSNLSDGVELSLPVAGERRFFRAAARPLPRRAGLEELSMVAFLDMTGQRRAEEELRDAVRARDELFSVATHELKDPLFSLQLSIQLLRQVSEHDGAVPPHVTQHLEVGDRQIGRLARLIDNMLDVARIAHGRIELEIEPLDLSELAQQVVTRFAEQAGSNGTKLTVEPSPPLVGRFDRLKIEQVIANLLSNAIKYGDGKPIQVRVRGEADRAVVEVEYQGAGIAPEDRERIFDRFERASNGHRQASLGLGLYIVRSLVEAHGGAIEVRSERGRGSTFVVTIPWDGAGDQSALGEAGGPTATTTGH